MLSCIFFSICTCKIPVSWALRSMNEQFDPKQYPSYWLVPSQFWMFIEWPLNDNTNIFPMMPYRANRIFSVTEVVNLRSACQSCHKSFEIRDQRRRQCNGITPVPFSSDWLFSASEWHKLHVCLHFLFPSPELKSPRAVLGTLPRVGSVCCEYIVHAQLRFLYSFVRMNYDDWPFKDDSSLSYRV